MRQILLDITPFEDKISLHRYLKEQLDLPFYYGANLDALYDELSSITEATALTLRYSTAPRGKMIEYTPRLLTVFGEAARENYNLSLVVQAA